MVPSPRPKHICNVSLVEAVSQIGAVVIAGGGGGIPVVRDAMGVRHGIDAVIDKDLTSAHMANVLGIDQMMILTAVSRVSLNYGTPKQVDLDTTTVSDLQRYLAGGHFPEGSMRPKIEAAIHFIEGGGKHVIIAHLEQAFAALKGEAGTHIFPNDC